MKHPHPWLVALASANVWLATASLLLTLAVFLIQPLSAGWYGSLLLGELARCPTAAAVVELTADYLAAAAAAFAPPVAWLLAARLLREVTAGRATLAVSVGGLRPLAPVGLWLAAVAMGASAWRWADPGFGGPPFIGRVTQGLNDCVLIEFRTQATSQRLAGYSVMSLARERTADPVNWGQRAVLVIGYEVRMLLAAVTPGAVAFCLCGVAACAARPDPEGEA